ncbi:hypothetical protein D3C83_02640 [compost metagenome]
MPRGTCSKSFSSSAVRMTRGILVVDARRASGIPRRSRAVRSVVPTSMVLPLTVFPVARLRLAKIPPSPTTAIAPRRRGEPVAGGGPRTGSDARRYAARCVRPAKRHAMPQAARAARAAASPRNGAARATIPARVRCVCPVLFPAAPPSRPPCLRRWRLAPSCRRSAARVPRWLQPRGSWNR